jgi:hypothetical protein
MQQPNSDLDGSASASEHSVQSDSDAVAKVATVAVVGMGAALFEAALLPGIILGVAAMWLPQHYPKMGKAFEPFFGSAIRGVNTANTALNAVDLASRVGRLTFRLGRRRGLFPFGL